MKKLLLYLLAAVVVGFIVWQVLSTKPSSAIQPRTPVESLTAAELYRQFKEDENLANERYLNKFVRVSGLFNDAGMGGDGMWHLWLSYNGRRMVHARMAADAADGVKSLQRGQLVTLRCRCVGLVDLVELRDCLLE